MDNGDLLGKAKMDASDEHSRSKASLPIEFWSSAEYDTFMRGLIASLRKKGVAAGENYQISSSAYRSSHGTAGRLLLRAQMYALYPARLFFHCRKNRNVLARVVCTNTFYAPLVAALGGRGPERMVHLVYDLFPDALFEAGAVKAGSFVARICDSIVRRTFHLAAANVFLGKRLLLHAKDRFGDIPNTYIIPVGADGSPFADSPPVPRGKQPIDILYCGNLGRLHDFETLVQALGNEFPSSGNSLRFTFHATGHGVKRLQEAAPSLGTAQVALEVGDFLAPSQWVQRMKEAQVALVTMRPGAERVLMPSKTYSALVAGQAILAVCNRNSDLADLVLQYDCGWVVEPGNSSDLKEVLQAIRNHPQELQRKRENAFRAGHTFFSTAFLAAQWRDLLQEVCCTEFSSPNQSCALKPLAASPN